MATENEERSAVSIEHLDSQWVVHFTVDGNVTQRSFGLAEHARSFAAGQRVRLGLPSVADNEYF
jgi:hypothetical protein